MGSLIKFAFALAFLMAGLAFAFCDTPLYTRNEHVVLFLGMGVYFSFDFFFTRVVRNAP